MTNRSGTHRGRYDDPHVLARIVSIRTMDMEALKAMWRDLYQAEPPRHNRKYLESRLAYRVQELAYGGLRPETLKRLEHLGEQLEGSRGRRKPAGERPVAGTRLVREWQGGEHVVTVLKDGFEYQGRPFGSLSAIARAITGTRWNGLVFFGLKSGQGRKA